MTDAPIIIYGSRDDDFKAFLISLLHKSGLKTKYINMLVSDENIKVYSSAFTHVTADPKHNYEFLEILGDVTCNKIIVWYIKDRFPMLCNTDGVKVIARLRINLVSKKNFSVLSEKLGFVSFISCDSEIREQKMKSILEDVFEAFFGATELLLDTIISPGAGYGICFRIFKSILDDMDISLRYEDLYDPITRLKETFDYFRSTHHESLWGNMVFENTRTDNGQIVHLYQMDKMTQRKILLAIGKAPLLDEAKQKAAQTALDIIEKKGLKRPVSSYYLHLNDQLNNNSSIPHGLS